MKLGLSPALALVLFGCTTTTPKEPGQTTCHVEISIDSDDPSATQVDLGAHACDEKRMVVIGRRDHIPDSYFVALTVTGPADHPIVSSDVLPISSSDASNPDPMLGDILLRNFPPLPEMSAASARRSTTAAPPPTSRVILPGHWNEIAKGEWPDTTPYRVLVRIHHS